MSSAIADIRGRGWTFPGLSLSLGGFLFVALTNATLAQGVQIPRDVDYGASGLVQFSYECDSENCSVRCYLHNTMVLEAKAVKSATFTSYRSHNRQNAPEKEVAVVTDAKAAPLFLNFAGDGGCIFESMKQTSAAGFLARVSVESRSKSQK